MANTKPFVSAAFFCEKILEENDSVVTAVRIVDTYYVTEIPEEQMKALGGLTAGIEVTGIVSLKSGDVTGAYTVGLRLRTPIGEEKMLSPEGGWPVVLKGGEHGVLLRMQFPLGVKNYGLCWFDVLWEGEVLTSMPLMLRRSSERVAEPKQS